MNTALVNATVAFVKEVGFPVFIAVYTVVALTHTVHKLTNALIGLHSRRAGLRALRTNHRPKKR